MATSDPTKASPNAAGREFVIQRTFNAPRQLVWDAFTKPEQLMQWWGPKGFKMLVCNVDLRPGGVFHYGMQSPDGHKMWGKIIYREIVAPERLVQIMSFSDENLGVTRHPMSPTWPLETLATITFDDRGGKTEITVRWAALDATAQEQTTFDSSHDSMRMGWTGTFDQFTDYLAQSARSA